MCNDRFKGLSLTAVFDKIEQKKVRVRRCEPVRTLVRQSVFYMKEKCLC